MQCERGRRLAAPFGIRQLDERPGAKETPDTLGARGVTIHRELMRLHVEALFTHDAGGRLRRVNEPGGAPAPRFFLGRTVDGIVRRFRRDVEPEVRRDLESALREEPVGGDHAVAPIDPSRYERILGLVAPIERTWTGPAFSFPPELTSAVGTIPITRENAALLEPHLEAWLPDVDVCQPMIALIVDGQAVSVCCSVRRTTPAHEAGVETAAPARGRGHAAQVATAWARAVRDLGAEPLYSTSWRNAASRAVARRLGLILFGTDLHIT